MTKKKEKTSDQNKSCIRTYTGKLFYPFMPSPKDVDIRDIAHHLSHICRFAGAPLMFWSVAQHAMLAADISTALSCREPRHIQLLRTHAVLHHDDSEAYCIDLPKPIKLFMPEYQALEDGVTAAISTALRVDTSYKTFVKSCDNLAYEAEASVLFNRRALKKELERDCQFARLARLSFQEAEQMFLDYSDLLSSEISEQIPFLPK